MNLPMQEKQTHKTETDLWLQREEGAWTGNLGRADTNYHIENG